CICWGGGPHEVWWRGSWSEGRTPPPASLVPLPTKSWRGYRRPMLYLVIKAALSGIIVAAVSEIARRYPGWGGLVASLPLTSLLAMIWLFRDTHEPERVAELSMSTFWFFLPSVPLFVALPLLIRSGVPFWVSMAIVITGTLALYAGWIW